LHSHCQNVATLQGNFSLDQAAKAFSFEKSCLKFSVLFVVEVLI